jgi:hypothetical protein
MFRAAVPETAVNEDGHALGREDDVGAGCGAALSNTPVKSEPKAVAVEL